MPADIVSWMPYAVHHALSDIIKMFTKAASDIS